MLKIKYHKRFELLIASLFVSSLICAPITNALELVISDNGSSAVSVVNKQVEAQTIVTQTNEAAVSNNINVEANTGGNTAEGNTGGDTNVQTGDINITTFVKNELNSSYVENETCCSSSDATISGNGSNSDNSVNLNQKSDVIVVNKNTADISNTIIGSSNTGENKVGDITGGNVSITTGNITIVGGVNNNSVNISQVKAGSGFSDVRAVIKDNGSDSDNLINAEFTGETNVYLNHSSNIENYILWDANTGENEVSGTTEGDVNITTGNVDIGTFIKNLANIGDVEIKCCKDIFDPGDDDDNNEEDDGNGGTTPRDGGNGQKENDGKA